MAGCSAVPGDAAFVSGRSEAAFKLYEHEYRSGNVRAGLRLAGMYLHGLGVPKDETKAFAIHKELAEKNVVVACHNLGVAYEDGIGTARNLPEAIRWYSIAAKANYVWSIYNLGALHARNLITPRDDIEGLCLLLHAIKDVKGNGEAARFIRNDGHGHVKRIKTEMTPSQIMRAEQCAGSQPPAWQDPEER